MRPNLKNTFMLDWMSVTMSFVFLWFYSSAEQDVATLAFLLSYDILPFSLTLQLFFFFFGYVCVRV